MLYFINSTYPEATHPARDWPPAAYGSMLCKDCRIIDRSQYPMPVDAHVLSMPRGEIFGLVGWTGISVFHVGLIDQLRPYLAGCAFGKCLDAEGNLIEDYVTCYSQTYIVLRGGKKSKYWICQTCGSISSQLGQDRPYLLRRQLTEAQVYQNAHCFMYVTEQLARQIDWSPWRRWVSLDPVQIRDVPIDGQRLPGDPDWSIPEATEAGESDSPEEPRRLARRKHGRSRHAKRKTPAAPFASPLDLSGRVSESLPSLVEVMPRLWPAEAGLICRNSSLTSDTREYLVPTRTLQWPGASLMDLQEIERELSGMPGAGDFAQLFAKHNGLGLFSPITQETPALAILPVAEWVEARNQMFGYFFDGIDAEFEDLPFGPGDVIPFASRCASPDVWFVVRTGRNAGKIHFWGHDGEPMQEQPVAWSLADFIELITAENTPDNFGGITRFTGAQAANPQPSRDTELIPMRYRIGRL